MRTYDDWKATPPEGDDRATDEGLTSEERDALHYEPIVHYHAFHGGDLCTFRDGTCSVCGVSESHCDECGGCGYHRIGCPEIES